MIDDRLEKMFSCQSKFMEKLLEHDLIVEWPLDIKSKQGQRLIKETIFYIIEELMEASFTLKNKLHRISDPKLIDVEHYREELGDAFTYLIELYILSGFTPEELYQEYIRKNAIVVGRLEKGY